MPSLPRALLRKHSFASSLFLCKTLSSLPSLAPRGPRPCVESQHRAGCLNRCQSRRTSGRPVTGCFDRKRPTTTRTENHLSDAATTSISRSSIHRLASIPVEISAVGTGFWSRIDTFDRHRHLCPSCPSSACFAVATVTGRFGPAVPSSICSCPRFVVHNRVRRHCLVAGILLEHTAAHHVRHLPEIPSSIRVRFIRVLRGKL